MIYPDFSDLRDRLSDILIKLKLETNEYTTTENLKINKIAKSIVIYLTLFRLRSYVYFLTNMCLWFSLIYNLFTNSDNYNYFSPVILMISILFLALFDQHYSHDKLDKRVNELENIVK